jgi:hypothetical protein
MVGRYNSNLLHLDIVPVFVLHFDTHSLALELGYKLIDVREDSLVRMVLLRV